MIFICIYFFSVFLVFYQGFLNYTRVSRYIPTEQGSQTSLLEKLRLTVRSCPSPLGLPVSNHEFKRILIKVVKWWPNPIHKFDLVHVQCSKKYISCQHRKLGKSHTSIWFLAFFEKPISANLSPFPRGDTRARTSARWSWLAQCGPAC